MYNEHFGLDQPPFKITPDTRLFYTGGGRGDVLDALVYAITSGEGIIKVTGEVGTGKTMLCRMLESRLPDNVDLVYLANPSLSPDDIVHAIALELGVLPEGEHNRIDLVFQLQQTLVQRHADNHRVVVLVEEAQSMPIETLEEIRLLSNLETKREKLLQIVLFGQPELDEKLALPEIRQLRERITHSFQLAPLAGDEIRDYLNFRLRSSGYRGRDAFAPDACRAISRASEGLTRRVNILADKALLAAYAEDTHDVERRHVKVAIKDSAFQSVSRFKPRPALVLGSVAVLAALLGFGGARLFEPSQTPAGTATASIVERGGEVAIRSAEASDAPAAEPPSEQVALASASATRESETSRSGGARAEAASDAPSERAAAASESTPRTESSSDPAPTASVADAASTIAETKAAAAETTTLSSATAPAAPMSVEITRTEPPAVTPAATSVTTVAAAADAAIRPTSKAAQAAAVTSVAVAAAPAPASVPAPAPKPVSGDLLEQRLAATDAWLGVADPDHYTIQLLATVASNRRSLLRFLERQRASGGLGDMYVYQTRIRGRRWFSVVFGSFENFSAANSALKALPSELVRQGPFIRNISDLSVRG